MAEINVSYANIKAAAIETGGFRFFDFKPPQSLGEDQYPACIVSHAAEWDTLVVRDVYGKRLNGEWSFQISFLFDKHIIDSQHDNPNLEMKRVRRLFLRKLQLEVDKSDPTEPPFIVQKIKHYESRLDSREIRVAHIRITRAGYEDYEQD